MEFLLFSILFLIFNHTYLVGKKRVVSDCSNQRRKKYQFASFIRVYLKIILKIELLAPDDYYDIKILGKVLFINNKTLY